MEAVVKTPAATLENSRAHRRKAIWISWERHRRTREISRALGTELFEITSPLPRLLKYPVLLLRTTLCLLQQRPSVLVIQCPSLILGLWAGLLKRVFRYTLVTDLHNEAVQPFVQSFPLYHTLLAQLRRQADLGLVSNAALVPGVERTGGRVMVLPDKVPQLAPAEAPAREGSCSAVFVCTYAPDEPYREVIEAARALGPSVSVHVTGDFRGVTQPLDPPASVRLTGFLPESEYVRLLREADVVIDLTCMEDCLVCGAYEAVALEKPLVTSDTRALREYFRLGTVYTKHDSQSLAAAIAQALQHRRRLAAEMKALKLELAGAWERQLDAVRRALRLEGGC